jgi:hypothetical protein
VVFAGINTVDGHIIVIYEICVVVVPVSSFVAY